MIDVILLEPENEGNIGAVARAMANFGLKNLIIVCPKCSLGEEFSKRAMHAKSKRMVNFKILKKIPKYDLLIGTTAKINTDYNLTRTPILSEQLPSKILPYIKKQKIALLFGRESIGLTNQELEKCDLICTINSSGQYSTLNLSHAAAIMFYEIHKNLDSIKAVNIKMADKKDKKILHEKMNELINLVETEAKNPIQKKIWKNAFSKAFITKREAFGMIGFLNKLKKDKKDKAKIN
ncbi:MAG: RNA methyltransferase [Candidatus Woesearchaeota archaeon]